MLATCSRGPAATAWVARHAVLLARVPLPALSGSQLTTRRAAAATPWEEELESRRRERISGGRSRASPVPPPRREEPLRPASSSSFPRNGAEAVQVDEEVLQGASQLQLFAYPANRSFPWATTSLLAAATCLSVAVAGCWQWGVARSTSVEELQARVRIFTALLDTCSVAGDDLLHGQVHKLVLPSLVHTGAQPARALADAAVLLCCGTLLERLRGAPYVMKVALGAAGLSNCLAALTHQALLRAARPKESTTSDLVADPPLLTAPGIAGDLSLTSTSGSVVALGMICALRHSRWAAWPGLPVPVSWLLAPILVADLSAAASYWSRLKEYRAAARAASGAALAAAEDEGVDVTPSLTATVGGAIDGNTDQEECEQSSIWPTYHLAVAAAGCAAAEGRARTECQPPLVEIEAWREELEASLEARAPLAPDGTFLADCWGVLFAVILVALSRGRHL